MTITMQQLFLPHVKKIIVLFIIDILNFSNLILH